MKFADLTAVIMHIFYFVVWRYVFSYVGTAFQENSLFTTFST